uniref:Uncharacterized protein n=1 Tax=Schistosoma curassoni TaxID=6186 RepID=A0A183K3Q3_9TREM
MFVYLYNSQLYDHQIYHNCHSINDLLLLQMNSVIL